MQIFPGTVQRRSFGLFDEPGDQGFLGLLFLALRAKIERQRIRRTREAQ